MSVSEEKINERQLMKALGETDDIDELKIDQ